MKTFGFPKQEKLKNKTEINLLFEKGKWHSCGNLKIISLKTDVEPVKLGVSVSKRYFKKAVHRNRIKRLLRESYRLNKEIFKTAFGNQCSAMLFWNSQNLPKHFLEVEQEFLKLCQTKK